MGKNRFFVIGLGVFGSGIARILAQKGAEVIAIDRDDAKLQELKGEVALSVALDATDIRALKAQNVADADAVVVAIGEDFESLVLCTVNLMELGCKRVISRANSMLQRKILEKLGVSEILSPENEVGNAVAERLLQPSIVSFLRLPDEFEIAEVKTPKRVANRSLGDISLRDKYNLNLITLEREAEVKRNGEVLREKHLLGIPRSTTVLYETDTIIVFGRVSDIQRFIEINQ